MRTFTKAEKEVISLINSSNNKKFSSLIMDVISNCKIVLDRDRNEITLHHKTKAFAPTSSELGEISINSQKMFLRIHHATSVTEILIREGYISLYLNQSDEVRTILGDNNIPDTGLIQNVEDNNTRDLFLRYCNQTLIVYPDLKTFISDGFKTKKELREIWTFRASWIGISVALITSIFSIILGLNKSQEKKLITITN